MTSSATSAAQHRLCRVARSPITLAAAIFFYAGLLLLFRDGQQHHQSTRLELRGATPPPPSAGATGDPAATFPLPVPLPSAGEAKAQAVERERVERWDPSPADSHPRREPVKGGVEIYPVQRARRPRTASTPLVPEVAEIEGVLTTWKMPEEYEQGGGVAIKGLYVMFHGCNHDPLDWFDLPEERAIVSHLVKSGYAVVAPASKDRVSGCWHPYGGSNGDHDPVRAVLWRWYRDWSIPPNTPLFLFGASSGGIMATSLAKRGGFQLCDKVTTYVQVSGALSQVSWGVAAIGYAADCPPIGFMPMPKGEKEDEKTRSEGVPPVFGNSRKIPSQVTSIAHYMRKAGGRPRLLVLPLGELSLYKAFFSDRVYEVSVAQSSKLYSALLETRALKCNPTRDVGSEPECFLAENPREAPRVLDALVATYLDTLDETKDEEGTVLAGTAASSLQSNGAAAAAAVAMVGASLDHSDRRRRLTAPLPILQPPPTEEGGAATVAGGLDGSRGAAPFAGGGGGDIPPSPAGASVAAARDRPAMTEAHATEVFRELLNVAWGEHEISADFVTLWEKWLYASCGVNCDPGRWR